MFAPEKSDMSNEVARWNKNFLNATASSVLADLKKDLQGVLETALPVEKIYFLNSQGKSPVQKVLPLSVIFSATTALGLALLGKEQSDVLYLGLEGFHLISATQWNSTWKSALGTGGASTLTKQRTPHSTDLGGQPQHFWTI